MNGKPPVTAAHANAFDAPYDEAATERWVPEPDKRPGRTAFQRDRARVLHSAGLRRLAGKTQVVDPGAGSPEINTSPRTRLTHSLECAQVGRELGAALGCDPDLVETACLAHDLGHPPFGHNGEQALADVARDIGGFEGNAQSLRLLTRIEPKRFTTDVPGMSGTPGTLGTASATGSSGASGTSGMSGTSGVAGGSFSVGLNLTRAALDAATKYPWPRGQCPGDPGSPKFGVYADDEPVFRWLRDGAPDRERCFEAEVMDWADDVAYSVHDVEDGLHAGHLDPNLLTADPERRDVCDLAARRYAPGADPAELGAALDRLLDQEWWPHGYDGSALAQARLKDAASQLIGRFCLAAETATRDAYGPGRLTRYTARLIVPRDVLLECAVLKAVADRYVMQRADQARRRADQRVLIAELAAALADRAPGGLTPEFRGAWHAAVDDTARARVVVDQIASLTDAAARVLHATLTRR